MSRTVRKQLFEAINSLEKVQKTLEQLLETSDSDALMQILTDCQSCAITIGNTIEGMYGKGTKSVENLEKYCEMIYQLAEKLGESETCKNLCALSKKQLGEIKANMQQEIPDKLEVVFLPYKASMWDSLESIWFAAEEDISCDAYVIPIPYYDKDPDGGLKEEHYEGKKYPDYVPITDYKSYDFETRRPDIIFIHNPYDAGNHVTSVHPFFYSKNLKQFTEKLVYVPYFVLDGNGIPENYAFTSAAIHADYIIVQNETEKEDYIRYFKENAPDFPIADKLLPLGSPKFDKVRSLNRENVNAPKEWLERSKDKKVILYNTSLNAMLENSEAYMQKLKDVFTFFENREDAILLWRPHPLMESSISSMRPELYEDYVGLKKEFLEKNIGIYDDTSDMYTAIGLSDAYYGDLSSVVWLYRQTGKPVLIQNTEVLGEEL